MKYESNRSEQLRLAESTGDSVQCLELIEMTRELGCSGYEWEAERINDRDLTYLIVYPKSDGAIEE